MRSATGAEFSNMAAMAQANECNDTCVYRKPHSRMRAKLKMIKEEMWQRMHQPIPEQGKWLGRVVSGYFDYHAVPTNGRALAVCVRAPRHEARCSNSGASTGRANSASGYFVVNLDAVHRRFSVENVVSLT